MPRNPGRFQFSDGAVAIGSGNTTCRGPHRSFASTGNTDTLTFRDAAGDEIDTVEVLTI